MNYKFQVGDLVEVEPSLAGPGGLALITGRWHNPRGDHRYSNGNEYTGRDRDWETYSSLLVYLS